MITIFILEQFIFFINEKAAPETYPNIIRVAKLRIRLSTGFPLRNGENTISAYSIALVEAFHMLVRPNTHPNVAPAKGPSKYAPIITGMGKKLTDIGGIMINPNAENARIISRAIKRISVIKYFCRFFFI